MGPDQEEKSKGGGTKVEIEAEYKGVEPTYDKVAKVTELKDPVNMELFYNQQITNLNMSWLLHHKKTGLSIVGITQEHTYGFSVDNSYNSGAGGALGQMITSAINKVHEGMKTTGLYANQWQKSWSDQFHGMANALEAMEVKPEDGQELTTGAKIQNAVTGAGSWLIDGAASLVDKGVDMVKNNNILGNILFKGENGPTMGAIANGKMITSFDKVMTYNGSNISITLPTLKTFIFHNPVSNGTNVIDMVAALTEVVAPKTAKSSIDGLYALQQAPGGFEVNLNVFEGQSESKCMNGTWTLTWNGYTIRNLLVTNMVVNYSKYNAMNNQGQDSGDPLYAEIDITLALASMLMTEDVMNIMTNTRTRYKTTGWNDFDENAVDGNIVGTVSKAGDVTAIGTNRVNSKESSTSYMPSK